MMSKPLYVHGGEDVDAASVVRAVDDELALGVDRPAARAAVAAEAAAVAAHPGVVEPHRRAPGGPPHQIRRGEPAPPQERELARVMADHARVPRASGAVREDVPDA